MLNQEIPHHSSINLYSFDNKGAIVSLNDASLALLGEQNIQDAIGRSPRTFLSQKKHATQWLLNNEWVINKEVNHFFLESATIKGKTQWYRCFKSPLRGHSGKIIGVSGFSIPIQTKCLIPLTKQQTACVKEFAMGHSYKQIAATMGLSTRTIEHYINTVKLKLNCETRAELIVHAFERGLIGIF